MFIITLDKNDNDMACDNIGTCQKWFFRVSVGKVVMIIKFLCSPFLDGYQRRKKWDKDSLLEKDKEISFQKKTGKVPQTNNYTSYHHSK